MKKPKEYIKNLVSVCLLSPFFTIAQNTSYFDSLNTLIPSLNKQEQASLIIAIPFDKINSNTTATIKLYKQALQLNLEDSLVAAINEKLSLAYYYKGNYDLSVEKSLAAISLYEKIKNEEKTGELYTNLGYQMKRRNLPKAFNYMQKGIQILRHTQNKKGLSSAYNNYGVLFEMNKQIDSALFYYQKGLVIIESLKDSLGIPYSLNNIAGAYVVKNEYDTAKKYYDRAFSIRKKRDDINGLAENYTYYGDLYFRQNQFTKAIPYYLKAKELSTEIEYTYLQKVSCEQLSICYENLNRFDKALFYQRKAVVLKDSLLNENTNKAIVQLETQFETAKKEKEIAKQKVALTEQELKVKQRNFFLTGMFGLVVFTLAISIFVYKQQKLKQQKLQEESRLKEKIAQVTLQNELHEERLRISRDLHDNIGSQLTFIISSVDNMKYFFKSVDEKLNSKLTDVSNFTRTTITQLRDTIWALNKDGISIKDLKARLYNYIENAKLAQEQIRFEFNAELGTNSQLNAIQGINIYRIVQEAINNTIKYAAATHVSLTISENDTTIIFSVKDDGVGFNMNEVHLGNGLENMENRAVVIGASFDIISEPARGTEILLTLPKTSLNQNTTDAV